MKKYLLVEGITDISFVKYVCFQKGITNKFDNFRESKKRYTFSNLVLINLDGQSNLEKELGYLKDEEIEISKIGIIQDADDDFDKSVKSIEDAMSKSKIDKNKVEYFLTPNNKELGDLETLLLSTLNKKEIPQLECFDKYKNCLKEHIDISTKCMNKGEVYSYTMFAKNGKNNFTPHNSFMCKNKKEYVDTKLWDLDKPEFENIISFIEDIFND